MALPFFFYWLFQNNRRQRIVSTCIGKIWDSISSRKFEASRKNLVAWSFSRRVSLPVWFLPALNFSFLFVGCFFFGHLNFKTRMKVFSEKNLFCKNILSPRIFNSQNHLTCKVFWQCWEGSTFYSKVSFQRNANFQNFSSKTPRFDFQRKKIKKQLNDKQTLSLVSLSSQCELFEMICSVLQKLQLAEKMPDTFYVQRNQEKNSFFFGRGGERGEQEKFLLTENSDLRQMPHCKKALENFRTGTFMTINKLSKRCVLTKWTVNWIEFLWHFVKKKVSL